MGGIFTSVFGQSEPPPEENDPYERIRAESPAIHARQQQEYLALVSRYGSHEAAMAAVRAGNTAANVPRPSQRRASSPSSTRPSKELRKWADEQPKLAKECNICASGKKTKDYLKCGHHLCRQCQTKSRSARTDGKLICPYCSANINVREGGSRSVKKRATRKRK